MTRLSDTELEAMLKHGNDIEPPADLAERIKSEIPDDLGTLDGPAAPRRSPQRTWLMAAGLLTTLGAGMLAFQLQREMPQFDGAPEGAMAQRSAETTAATQADDTAATPSAVDDSGDGSVTEAQLEALAQRTRARVIEPTRLPAASAEPATTPAPELSPSTDPSNAVSRRAVAAEQPSKKTQTTQPSALLYGRIVDTSGVALPGATVELSGNESRIVASDASGQFGFPDLTPGKYTVEASLEGFSTVIYEGVNIRDQRNTTLEMQLNSAIEETITVTAESPLLDERKVTSGIQVTAIDEKKAHLRQALSAKKDVPKPTARRLDQVATTPAPPGASAQTSDLMFDSINIGGTGQQPSNVNDAAHDQMYFESAGTNPFVDTEDDRLSTFGLDVDTGSYTVTRRYLRDGNLPPKDAVRVEEFVNYFDYRDAPPQNGDDFALHAQGAPSIYGEGERYHLLRFGLRGRDIDDENRKPALLTFVVDVSGSMARENRLGLVRQALTLLVEQLRDDDLMALVIYGSSGQVLLEPTGDRQQVLSAIHRLQSGGSTNAGEGLRLAYEMAARHTEAGMINRVILCSDGVANVGNTGPDSILASIEKYAQQGIELTTVGFGMGNYNDVLMEQLADRGNGRYAYVDTLEEARRIFVEDLTGTLQTLAAEARAQVAFNPDVVSRYRLVGYENRDIADERFRDDTVDAGEIGVGHRVTALYEVKTHRPLRKRDKVATLHLRYASIARGEMVEQSLEVTGSDFARTWNKADRALQLTSLVAEFAEILKGSYWAKSGDLSDVFQRAQKVATEYPGDADIAEFASLVGKVQRIQQR